jgi:hypothetical protein
MIFLQHLFFLSNMPNIFVYAMFAVVTIMAVSGSQKPWLRRLAQLILVLTVFWILHNYLLNHPNIEMVS